VTEDAGLEATLGRVSLQMARTLDLDEVLGEVVRGLVRDLGAALARVWLLERGDPKVLRLAASAGLSARTDGTRSRVPVGDLKIGEIARERVPLCENDLAADPRFVDKAWIRRERLVSFGGYPLVFDDELLGVVAMFARRPLTKGALERLGIFAAHASVAIKNAALFAHVTELSLRLEAENASLREELDGDRPRGIVGEGRSLVRVLEELERVAATASTVLLQGETGTGKELFARAIHEMSPRKRRALVKVNCAAISPMLVESELFGHEKGAFTGALQKRPGRFELAHGGTLLLDEVGELPLEAQAKLLRVLQEHEIERVGGAHPIPVDVRVVAATNRDLEAEVRAGRFRADLYFRLAVFPIRVPPLRERREDVPALAEALLRGIARRLGESPKSLTDDALAHLRAYAWPGNVRELQNVLERAAILTRGPQIRRADLPPLTGPAIPKTTGGSAEGSLKERVEAFERALVEGALEQASGNQSEAARLLRTSRATLQYKMKLYRL